MDLIGVVSLSWLEVEDGRVQRPVGFSFGRRSRGKVQGGGVALGGGCGWLEGFHLCVSNGGGKSVATPCCGWWSWIGKSLLVVN